MICKQCKVDKPLEFFRFQVSKNYLHKVCKQCTKENDKKRYYSEDLLANNEALLTRKMSVRESRIKSYGISITEYEDLILKTEGKCQICGSPPFGRKHNIDHCHVTGKVRGLLCRNCNLALGHFKDNPKFLEKAIKYLN